MKSDMRSYHASLEHAILIGQLRALIADERMLDFLLQYLDHLDDVNGELFAVDKGISQDFIAVAVVECVVLQPLDTAL